MHKWFLALVCVMGAVGACASFGAAASGDGGVDAGANEAGSDASTPGDGGIDDNDSGPAPTRGAVCGNASTYCGANDVCCFQISPAVADTCVRGRSACTADAAADAGAFVLECSDGTSCPGFRKHCCFKFAPGAGSRCSAARCLTDESELCSGQDDCGAAKTCTGKDTGLDDYYTRCK